MRKILPFLLVLLCFSQGCTILNFHMGNAPSRECALVIEPRKSTLEEVLGVLGPPDAFCEEMAGEFGASGVDFELDFPELPGARPHVLETPDDLCLLWVGAHSRSSEIDFGRGVQVATIALGARGYVPLIFGSAGERASFVRIRLGPDGVVDAVHVSGVPEEFGYNPNPFR